MGIKNKLRTLALAGSLALGMGMPGLSAENVPQLTEQQIGEHWTAEYPKQEEGRLKRDLVDFMKGIEEEFKGLEPVGEKYIHANFGERQKQISTELKETIIRAYASDSKARILPLSLEDLELTLNRYVDIVFGTEMKGREDISGLALLETRDVFLKTEENGSQRSAEEIAETALHELIGHIVMGYGESLTELYEDEIMGYSRGGATSSWLYNPFFEKILLDQSSPEEFWKNTVSNEQYAKLWDSKFGDTLSHDELEKIKAVNYLILSDSTSEQAQEFSDFMNIENNDYADYERRRFFAGFAETFLGAVAPEKISYNEHIDKKHIKIFQEADKEKFRKFVDSINTFIKVQHKKGKLIIPQWSIIDYGKEAAEKSRQQEIYARKLERDACDRERKKAEVVKLLIDYSTKLNKDTMQTLLDIYQEGIDPLYSFDEEALESLSPEVMQVMKEVDIILKRPIEDIKKPEPKPINKQPAEPTETRKILSKVLAEKLMPQLVAENNQRIMHEDAFLNAWNAQTAGQQQGRSV